MTRLNLAKPRWFPLLAVTSPPKACLGKLSTERLRGGGSRCSPTRAHVGIPARQRDSWPVQRNFDFPRCGGWLLTLDFWQEGAHEDRDTKRRPNPGINDFILQISVRGPRAPAVKVQFLQVWKTIHCRGRPKWNSREDRGSTSGCCPNPTVRCSGFLVQPRGIFSTSSRSRPWCSSILQCSSYCGCMGCVK